jgi:hypothetical protein
VKLEENIGRLSPIRSKKGWLLLGFFSTLWLFYLFSLPSHTEVKELKRLVIQGKTEKKRLQDCLRQLENQKIWLFIKNQNLSNFKRNRLTLAKKNSRNEIQSLDSNAKICPVSKTDSSFLIGVHSKHSKELSWLHFDRQLLFLGPQTNSPRLPRTKERPNLELRY